MAIRINYPMNFACNRLQSLNFVVESKKKQKDGNHAYLKKRRRDDETG